ncbi:glycosyl hydrolase family 3 C-terminal domain-containing protein [Jimgerdemannia flammicorona]|uniref:beta-glucosidase n=1 Tax=Jimgerdemannia flammicorona TaxID=994334 RepID=A0A433AHG7_9FUNG|nr:glycosyl hydrolase family 3 C-terminal domain-containing protein [Jimgerdemannia flammicorona]
MVYWFSDDSNLQGAASANYAMFSPTRTLVKNTVEGNMGDRNDLNLWYNGNALIEVNPNTIVVLHTVGPVLILWANHPNITAIVYALLPGQESGNALADVLFGDVNPSGRLLPRRPPITPPTFSTTRRVSSSTTVGLATRTLNFSIPSVTVPRTPPSSTRSFLSHNGRPLQRL